MSRDVHRVREGLRAFLEWHRANPDVAVEDLWEAYDALLRRSWEPFGAPWIAARVSPPHRVILASACARLALGRAWFAPRPGLEEGAWEARLWEVALALDRRGVEGVGWGGEGLYLGPAHRLADLYRRAGRSDAQAVAWLIEVASGPLAATFPDDGPGSHYRAEDLIYQGARITGDEPQNLALVRVRLGLCLRLKLREFAAPWVRSSIEAGQARLQAAAAQGAQAAAEAASALADARRAARSRGRRKAATPASAPASPPASAPASALTDVDLETEAGNFSF